MESIEKINQILLERGLTGADLSRAIGVSNGVYSQWNKGRTKPSAKNIVKIAEFLEVPPGELLPDIKGPIQVGRAEVIARYEVASPDVQRAVLDLLRAATQDLKYQGGDLSEK